ncbi:hypothetical protein [Roseiterribacter gracilis]|uniref:DUF2927 domain-containing protein n=1 Tax=Roseiterribacter gracilis TaxID=2812848 RepID=A0A8S8XIE5_9PROT|nr:hypothetical protein TMPK1_40090 [Rhodospirillales bacterium TMPK1]
MKRILLIAAGLLVTASAYAAEPVECAPQNKLCQHLARLFASDARDHARVVRWEETDPIRFTTIGLPAETAGVFEDLLEGLAQRAGLRVRRVEPSQIDDAQIAVFVPDDPELRDNPRRIAFFLNAKRLTSVQTEQLALRPAAFRTLKPRSGRNGDAWSGRVVRCAIFLRPDHTRPAAVGFLLARQIYQCLSGFSESEAAPSLLNWSNVPPSLITPPYAKMSALDSALLQILYEPGDALFEVPRKELVARIEARLRAEGFRDDGTRP